MDLKTLTIKKAHEHLAKGDFSAVELSEAYLKNIEIHNKNINAYLEVFDDAKEQAQKAQKLIETKTGGMLAGIPVAMKDNILIQGKRASSASKILEGYMATYDATVVKKLKVEGAVFLGRTNMDEFAMGGSTENSAFGVTKNPIDTTRVPGGSSGGSAAALAMDGALAALGSDTGGSIRQPAAFCGLVGLKPTYGTVSRYGLMAMASSLDQIGPFGKTVEDAEILFNAIAGHDPMDSTSIPDEMAKRTKGTSEASKKMTIGIPKDILDSPGIDADVLKNFNEGIAKLKSDGYLIKDISLPNMHYALSVYYVIMPAEASANLSRFDGVRYGLSKKGATPFEDYAKTRGEGFGREVRRRILLGAYVLSSGYYDAYYNKAWSLRNLISKDFADVFKEVDVIATPTTPTPAFKLGEKSNDPLAMYLADVFTVPANLIGIPALTVPSGAVDRDGKKIPLGLQFMAPHFREDILFRVGKSSF
ncbi:Asp-tRNA(Asn)/Glu-tRNA(Gln) amidotransferase subunit GatA [Candidatus Peregrinibacteria bacterium]|nr:Asp-tRNA(Asn)/Glu-tRNA(Gln) amidotransferase subunit GatA [Candidatus Peregrinibacteria bacterium]